MFWKRFIELCNKAGKSPNAVATACGVKSSGTVTGWSKGSIPRTPVLHKIADYFHVTVDYLLGNVDLPFLSENEKGILNIDPYALTEAEKPTSVSRDGLNDEQRELVNLFDAAPPAIRAAALAVLKSAEGLSKVQDVISTDE